MKRNIIISSFILMAMFVLSACEKSNSDDSDETYKTGTFTDSRDGKEYKTITIGSQTWITEPISYVPQKKVASGYWAYDNNNSNVEKYGYLYNYETAVSVVPQGWHIPSVEELNATYETLGKNNKLFVEKLGLVMGGKYNSGENSFSGLGTNGEYWLSNDRGIGRTMLEIAKENDEGTDYYVGIGLGDMPESYGLSVLCVKD